MSFRTQIIRGETLTIALEVVTGDAAGAVVTSQLKKAKNGSPPSETADVLKTLVAEWRESLGEGLGAGWVFTTETADLPVGEYITDARIVLASGFIDYAEPVIIEVKPRVTV